MIDESEKYEVDEKLKLLIPLKNYRQLLAYVDLVDNEVSGFADVEFDPEKMALVMGEVYLMEQEVSRADTEIDEEDVAKFTLQMVKQGREQLPRLWWHSHADMGVFWSGTDNSTIELLKNDSFSVALETNHAHEFICSMMLWRPFPLRVNNLPVQVMFEYKTIPQYLKQEVEKKVKETRYTYGGGTYGRQERWWDKGGRKAEKEKSDGETRAIVGVKGAQYLPKSRHKAIARIKENGLERIWMNRYQMFAYQDPITNQIWLDIHQVLEEDFGISSGV